MRSMRLWLLTAFVVVLSLSSSSALQVAQTGQGPAMASVGLRAFGPDGTLFAADNQNAAIFAFDLGAHVGNRVRALRRLGARVIAVEPQPDFARILRLFFGRDAGVTIVGASDHTVTHSLYIEDPDGNEIELYVDVPGVDWANDPSLVAAPIKPLRL